MINFLILKQHRNAKCNTKNSSNYYNTHMPSFKYVPQVVLSLCCIDLESHTYSPKENKVIYTKVDMRFFAHFNKFYRILYLCHALEGHSINLTDKKPDKNLFIKFILSLLDNILETNHIQKTKKVFVENFILFILYE